MSPLYMPAPEPDEEQSRAQASPQEPAALTAETIEQLTSIALFAGKGERFHLGTRELARQFVSIDTEQAITNRVLALAHTYPGATLADVFALAQAEMVEMAAWILADYDALEGEQPDDRAAEAWLRNKRNEITTKQIISLVLGQVELHDQAVILGKALLAAGLLEQLVAALKPPSPLAT